MFPLLALLLTQSLPAPLPPVPAPPQLIFAFQARVELGNVMEVGAVPRGRRRIIPIVGGTFEGPGLKGRVLNNGADWQIVRADGLAERRMDRDVLYFLEGAAHPS